ncbi:hypothetical protein [Polyangium sorediatum]|uniref:Uncharacterized protein n=1 Tax=Polyangium sorediatum TaxID=889274 RepID=A0ABT6P394_9BACT|nr:hypothetical protein [Polyangium sorediatum]MDI1435033.1 hypothetical protein [Polyangium sorediatum]
MELKIALVVGAVGAVAGCAGSSSSHPTDTVAEPEPAAGNAALMSLDENMARLRALAVFDVGHVNFEMPGHSGHCYSVCKHRQIAALRVDKLADVAESAAKTPAPDACDEATIEKNLAALNALGILEVRGLIKDEPKNSTNCYGQPCPDDAQASKALTCERAGKLASIVNAAKDL